MIGRSGERGSGISVLPARYDDDDDITFKLPRGDMDMPPRPRNFFRYLVIGMCHFRHLWNGMCDFHQAEITVMQFTGHSLPVHQSMSIPWDFYLVPFFQPSPPTRFLLITAIRMCHLLPVHHFGMACLAGLKVNIQHMYKGYIYFLDSYVFE